MRLGDLDALKETKYVYHDNGEVGERLYISFDEIDNAPTVDAVPVVRCKDCKHGQPMIYRHTETPCIMCSHLLSGFYARLFNPNWFCADGERREDG